MRKYLVLALTLACLLMAAMPALADTDFTFNRDQKTLFEGETLQLTILRQGGALADGEIEYKSSAPRIASVDKHGAVTGNAKGEATITATLKLSKKTYKTQITLTVMRPVREITVNEEALTVYEKQDDPMLEGLLPELPDPEDENVTEEEYEAALAEAELPVLVALMGRETEVRATCLPKDASNRRFTLSVSDDKVAKVTGSAIIRPVAPGVCVLTVASTSNPEVNVQYRLLVIQPVKGITLSAVSRKVGVGGTVAIQAAIQPADASITGLTWTSENPRIATVDEYGVVTGLTKGQTTIRARAVDGSKRSATIEIAVVQQPTEIRLDTTNPTVAVGSYKTLRPTVLPNNTNDKTVEWISSNERVAKVNSSGRINPVSAGTCIITCRSKSFPEVFTTAYLTVTQPVTRIAFSQKTVNVDVFESVNLYWDVQPYDATDPSVTLKSSNERIARVSQDGTVYGVKRGEATITATANDGSGRRASVTVNVTQPVMGVHMKNDTVSIDLETPTTLTAELEPADASNTNMTWYSSDDRIASVTGRRNRPVVTGHAWGTVTITGVTEDGGYTTECTVNVGNYDKALSIHDLYVQGNKVKITVRNDSNMTITRFTFVLALFDVYDQPLACNPYGGNAITGSYSANPLYEGSVTTHGRFTFDNFIQPDETIGRVELTITGYYTDDGYVRNIRQDRQPYQSFTTEAYVGPLMVMPETPEVPENP